MDDQLTEETTAADPAYVNTLFVRGESGTEFEVATQDEKDYFEMNLVKYKSEFHFENVSDLQDVDRLLGLELLSYRYTAWLVKGSDYDGLQFSEKDVRDHKQKVDTEIRLLKKNMGMDRKGRVESEAESVSEYLRNLLRRAGEFGVHRDTQVAKALDLFNDLKTMIGLHDRTDEEEQRHLGVTETQIIEWIRSEAIPEYDAVDDAFRKNQRMWIKDVS
jgi:hypothetical protein